MKNLKQKNIYSTEFGVDPKSRHKKTVLWNSFSFNTVLFFQWLGGRNALTYVLNQIRNI